MMHMHYCENDVEGIVSLFAPDILWMGAGEDEYIVGREACVKAFAQMKGSIPRCNIWDEEYDAIQPSEGIYLVTGRMWIATDPSTRMYLKAHQRVSFVFQEEGDRLLCAHIHCSNPYQEMMEGERFPEKIGRQSFDYVEERMKILEEEMRQKNRQMEVIMSSIAGGLKISNDGDTYSYAFVSREAAALFGYTVDEFMEATGGTAVGNVYPPDLPGALADCEAAFKNGGLTYSTRYRVRCRDGSLKWIIDSGKKAQDADGRWMVNSIYLDITQSEENAQRLREQTELLASIYDTVPCGIVRFSHGRDGSYRLISTNRTAILLQGYDSMEEGLADWHDGVLGNVLPQDQDLLRSCYAMLKQPGDRQDKEYRARWKDGSVHWMEGTNMVVGTTPEGDHIIQRTIVDITQRKALQVQLEREQEMYRVSMEASAAVMFEYLMDEDVFISYEPRPGMGVWRNELHNYSNILLEQEIIHPEDIPIVLDNICGGRAECFEVRCATPEGQHGVYTWYRVNCRLIVEEGKPDRVVGASYNIHEMKSLLSENSKHLYMNQSALQAINDVYVSMFYVNLIQDSYYAVRLPDAGRKKTLPRTGRFSESLNRYILEQTDEADRERVESMCARDWLLQEITQENEHMEAEFRLAGQEDGGSWYRLEIHLVAMEQSRPKTIIIAIRNISSEKQKELEHREEEKKAKQALEEAYAAANRANQAKSEFLSRMSHDIRTPMNAILGMAAVAEHNLDNRDKLKDCLLKIHTSGDHLLELINAVLDMSKIESGSVCLVENPFSLSGMMEEVAQIIQTDIGQKGQHLFVRLEGLVHDAVHGDMVRVKEILLNLLSNAVKYTPENGTIKVSLEEKLSSRSGVGCFEFIVEDDGIGMTQAFQEKMFTPFERAEDERVSQTQGTGLGLPITLNLVQMMNGTIQVESHLNKGTRFVVTIYLKLVMDQDKTHSQDREPPVKAPRTFRPGTRILLAEDNELNREIVKELLSLCGLEITCAANGREAVELFEENPPGTFGLILMDIQMPVLDGYGATMAIRRMGADQRRPDGAGIPIIALTANAFADDAYKAKQAGMNEHVTKPLDLDRLLETMHRWMD
ncbi:MAG: response regulator [Enterocloster citroniae]|nr:response regulator [Enterocloster citroniae]